MTVSTYSLNQAFFAGSRTDGGVAARQASEHYSAIRQASIAITAPLSAEDMAAQPLPGVGSVKWYLAHSTWFFEHFLLKRFVKDYAVFHPVFASLYSAEYGAAATDGSIPHAGFQAGGDPNGDPVTKKNGMVRSARYSVISRPGLSQIRAYRLHVDSAVQNLIAALPEEARPLLELGLQYEQQQQECMLAGLKHLFSLNPLFPAYQPLKLPPARDVDKLVMHEFKGGLASMGKTGNAFAFDNELPHHRVFIAPFMIADRKVTNGEYLAFVEAQGYANLHWWYADGVEWLHREQVQAPLYWHKVKGVWYEYTLHGLLPLDLSRPVCHVSYYEADAFARFSRARLPTEAEWEFAANAILPSLGGFAELNDKKSAREERLLHPAGAPVMRGLKQFFTDAWEWTSSCYGPYPGFQSRYGAAGNHARQLMLNQYVLRGASVITPQGHSRSTYRHHARAEDRWHFSGIRLARDGTE